MLAARRMMIQAGCTTSYSGCDTVTDSFNRADAGDHTLGTSDSGHRWIDVPGWVGGFDDGYWTTQGTTANTAQAQVPVIDHYRAMVTLLNAHGNNQDLTVDGECDHDNSIGLWVRATADAHFGYHVFFTAFSGNGVYKFVNGTGTFLVGIPNIALNTPFTGRVVVHDNTLAVYMNGTLETSVTIDPDDAHGFCETDWTYMGLREDNGGSGGSAPTQVTVYTNTHWDSLSAVPS